MKIIIPTQKSPDKNGRYFSNMCAKQAIAQLKSNVFLTDRQNQCMIKNVYPEYNILEKKGNEITKFKIVSFTIDTTK